MERPFTGPCIRRSCPNDFQMLNRLFQSYIKSKITAISTVIETFQDLWVTLNDWSHMNGGQRHTFKSTSPTSKERKRWLGSWFAIHGVQAGSEGHLFSRSRTTEAELSRNLQRLWFVSERDSPQSPNPGGLVIQLMLSAVIYLVDVLFVPPELNCSQRMFASFGFICSAKQQR